jgi:hypothetical protein
MSNKNKTYHLVVNVIIGGEKGGLQELDFKVSQAEYNAIRRQLVAKETVLVFRTVDTREPVYLNLLNPNLFTIYTVEREAPKSIVMIEQGSLPKLQ